ncbi:MAG: hypothetical protein HYW95_01580 [Candidatus Wildermuthbacteria bacterium]|nr:hypothetical protein [Candidatus Wildermuthbacteria bacterium]
MRTPLWLKIFFVVVIVLVVGAVVYGLVLVGSPSQQRAVQFDQRRISDLQGISYAIDSYWQRNKELPSSLEDLRNQQPYTYVSSIRDPLTGELYEYRVQNATTYELCAAFATDTSSEAEEMGMPKPFFEESWDHGIGRQCFTRQVRISVESAAPAIPQSSPIR